MPVIYNYKSQGMPYREGKYGTYPHNVTYNEHYTARAITLGLIQLLFNKATITEATLCVNMNYFWSL